MQKQHNSSNSLFDPIVDNTLNYMTLDYSDILKSYGLKYEPNEYFWQVGKIHHTRGWILHLTVIRSQLLELLQTIVPELIKDSISYKIIRDYEIAGTILDGSLGFSHLGKMVSIYPTTDEQALFWGKKLVGLTRCFRGPVISSAIHLGSTVYTCYDFFDRATEISQDESESNFQIKNNISWPFSDITMPQILKPKKILNNAYYPLAILKSDPKGDVVKGIYFKQLWQLKFCIIKQGRLNMFSDDMGRDIQDRLKWQYDLYQELADTIPFPEIFNYFKQGDDTYLVMNFIKGISLGKWVDIAYQHRVWKDLPALAKLQIVDMLTQLLMVVDQLHKKGYIHRDITPENFLVDKTGKLYLIDMELSWNSSSAIPNPPFRLGTPGFMSPEQYLTLTPTIKEDIYGIGALMQVFFTNLSPMKFHSLTPFQLEKSLSFFIGEDTISNLIIQCLDSEPAKRPTLSLIIQHLANYRETIQEKLAEIIPFNTNNISFEGDLTVVIQAGLCGLSFPMLLSAKKRWASRVKRKNKMINEQIDLTLLAGWHTGMAGPLWLVAKAKKQNFSIQDCQIAYESSWEYLNNHLEDTASIQGGLYHGRAGIALAFEEGLSSGMLEPDHNTSMNFMKFLSYPTSNLSLSTGLAGQGIALLQCSYWIENEEAKPLLNTFVTRLIDSQQMNGSWDILGDSRKKDDILIGLDDGVAGIIWFLLIYIDYYPGTQATKAVRKGLTWLIRKANKKGNAYSWKISLKNHSTDLWDTGTGLPGIILTFIKAYEVFKDPIYRQIAESSLQKLRPRPTLMNFTLGSGLAGLGEVYLEAFKAFDNQIWKERADWIAQVLIHCFQEVSLGAGFWLPDPTNLVTSDLFSGNSGILHFLMRCNDSSRINHPLDPNHKRV